MLIKVGQEKYIDQLQQKGLIYSNTVKYFREHEIEEIELRRDKREGANSSLIIKNLKLYVENKELPLSIQNAHINTFDHYLDMTHIYCLYAATHELADGQPFIDPRMTKFGDTALLITNPGEFIKRIEHTLKNKFTYKPVEYYSDTDNYTQLTIFNKPESFKFQREFRFHFEHIDINDNVFEIGSIEDISIKINSDKIHLLIMK